MDPLKVSIGVMLIGMSIVILFMAGNGYYQRCLSSTAGIGPAIYDCPYREASFYLSLAIFVPVMVVATWIIIRGAKELPLNPLKKKA